ncbi:MAG: protein phosphatase 2C domain-containing protein [Gammaproteobacteria bacterium]|nr:protein phosphatase 2C domain-containing protein [Gammaproteobacteria bacterium]MDE0511324.1 protein phosphatase 2C domain-containing protein [Gammaproteobacteria bacterium]
MNDTGYITIAALTDRGRKRLQNEDSILTDADTGIVILADGLGGHNAGEVASALAVNVVHEQILQGLQDTDGNQKNEITGVSGISRILERAVIHANSAIHAKAQMEIGYQGMGTTIVVCAFHNDLVATAHVGDSRLYRKRGENFTQLTEDHFTWPYLDRALGIEEVVLVDVMEETIRPGDMYLLCSDGLTDMVGDEDIGATLAAYDSDPERAALELVQTANENGGKDNISVILVKIGE